ncbi:uncharacterized protein [Ptychodera flava]|uniref:uncharacterized protein n=1 Tax=Ptychodera flava TaxID=63121 RepID=UPI00396A38B9
MDDSMHVMISYNWDHQEEVIRIKEKLEQKGYKIWIDLDNMRGNINRAMAEGVEGACVILMCVTDAYKTSFNCEKEAGYADSLRKPIIPLKLENDVRFDGWIGPIIGSKLWFDFSDMEYLDEKIESLDAELVSTGMKELAFNPDAKPPFMSLDPDGICEWLKDLSIDDGTIKILRENCVTGKDLAVLTKEELVGNDFKVRPFIATKILRNRDEAMGVLPPNITARCSTPSEMGLTTDDEEQESGKTATTMKEKLKATSTAPSTKQDYKKGDRVQVQWYSSWYDAEVIEEGPVLLLKVHYEGWDSSYDEKVEANSCAKSDGTTVRDSKKVKIGEKLTYNSYDVSVVDKISSCCKIRYDGYGSSWDTWVLPNEIKFVSRPPKTSSKSKGSKTTTSKNHKYKVDDPVSIFWAGSWYTGRVLEPGPHLSFKIHYDGWSASYDESVDVTKMQMKGGSKIKDAKKIKKGDKVQTLWGSSWYDSTVLEVTSAVCKVRYDQYGPSWDTWCTPDEVKPR